MDAGAPTGKGYHFRTTNSDNGDGATAAVFDASGNLIFAGNFANETIQLGGGVHTHPPKSYPYDHNIFVAKYSPSNNYLWSKTFGGDQDVYVHAAAVGPSGEVWITGAFSGSFMAGAKMLTAPDAMQAGYQDLFLIKLDQDGNVVFAERFGNDYRQYGLSIAVDSAGSVIIGGVGFDLMDFGTGPFGSNVTFTSFAFKLDPNGAPVWVDNHVYWNNDFALYPEPARELAVAVDKDDHVLLAGNFYEQTYFGDQIDAPHGGTDGYVIKLDKADGTLLWKTFVHGVSGADGDQWMSALAADPCTGDVYAGGSYRGSAQVDGLPSASIPVGDPAAEDMFLLKLSGMDGSPQWIKTFGDAGLQRLLGVGVDVAGNVVATGALIDAPGYQGVDFGPGIGVLGPLVAPDPDAGLDYSMDVFVLKLDPMGGGIWGYRLGDQHIQLARTLGTDPIGNIAIAGEFAGTLKLPSFQVFSANGYDAFVGWMRP